MNPAEIADQLGAWLWEKVSHGLCHLVTMRVIVSASLKESGSLFAFCQVAVIGRVCRIPLLAAVATTGVFRRAHPIETWTSQLLACRSSMSSFAKTTDMYAWEVVLWALARTMNGAYDH
jgi:hypothetical protein